MSSHFCGSWRAFAGFRMSSDHDTKGDSADFLPGGGVDKPNGSGIRSGRHVDNRGQRTDREGEKAIGDISACLRLAISVLERLKQQFRRDVGTVLGVGGKGDFACRSRDADRDGVAGKGRGGRIDGRRGGRVDLNEFCVQSDIRGIRGGMHFRAALFGDELGFGVCLPCGVLTGVESGERGSGFLHALLLGELGRGEGLGADGIGFVLGSVLRPGEVGLARLAAHFDDVVVKGDEGDDRVLWEKGATIGASPVVVSVGFARAYFCFRA